jgi:hypothetical protein
MAKSSEHKMLFDIRGRRKRVIQVVYAALALLMALSLFTVVGPVSFGDLFGGGGSGGSDAGNIYEDQAKTVERKLAKDPRNEELLLRDVKVRSNAASSETQTDPSTGQTGLTTQGLDNYAKAADAWLRYMKLNPKDPNPTVAQRAATALFYTAATSSTVDFPDKIKGAAEAQTIYADAKPSLNSYLTLAQYSFFAGNFAAGDEAGRKAVRAAPASQRAAVNQAVQQYRNNGQQVQKELAKASKFKPGGGGKQALENPLGGLSGGGPGGTSP